MKKMGIMGARWKRRMLRLPGNLPRKGRRAARETLYVLKEDLEEQIQPMAALRPK
jgi:hypothetical protein